MRSGDTYHAWNDAFRWWKLAAFAAIAAVGCGHDVIVHDAYVGTPADSEGSAGVDGQPVQVKPAAEAASFYTVAKYDPQVDPAKELVETIRIAQDSKKRILLQVGGEWCGWCHKLDNYIADHAAVSQAIGQHFLIMKVNFSDENKNEAFLAQYPTIPGYPHLYVLESDGTLLHSQNTVELEEGSSYNEAALLAFVDRWKAS